MTDLALPLTLADGDFLTVEQGSFYDRTQRLAAILNTRRGDLDHNQEFGRTVAELTTGGADIDQVRADLLSVEPDLEFEVIDDPTTRTPGSVTDNISIAVPEDD